MIEKGHQPKHLVVLEAMHEVLLMTRELKKQIVKGRLLHEKTIGISIDCMHVLHDCMIVQLEEETRMETDEWALS